MTLTLELTREQQARLERDAARHGLDPAEYLRRLIEHASPEGSADLPSRGSDRQQAADLRARLRAFADDWERPEMDAYDAV